MKYLLIFVFTISIYQVIADSTEDNFFPSYIRPCNLTDDFETCLKDQIEETLPFFTKGIPEYNIPSVDPVGLDDIIIDGNGLKLSFTDAKMHGLSKVKVTELKVHLGQEQEKLSLKFVANLSLTAQYNADGKILILPIKGQGDAFIECRNVDVEINSKLAHHKEKNGDHLKLVTPNYKYDIESTTFDLKNLFNGNKQLADTTLQFANENWRQLMDDLAPPAIKQIVKTIVKVINKFFSKIATDRIIIGYERYLNNKTNSN